MIRLGQLEGEEVVSEAGERIGHVWEVRGAGHRVHEPPQASHPIDVLLCGRLGLLERLGWKERRVLEIPWTAVANRRDGRIVVRGRAADYKLHRGR